METMTKKPGEDKKPKPDMMAATKGLAKNDAPKSDSKKSKKKKPHMKIRPIENDQYLVENSPDPNEMEGTGKMERKTEHAGDLAMLHKHIDEHYGAGSEQEAQAAPAPAPSPAPSPAPAQPMPQMPMGR